LIELLCPTLKPPAKVVYSTPAQLKWKEGPNYTVSSDGRQATKTAPDGDWCATPIMELGDEELIEWGVRTKGYVMIGVAPATINQTTTVNYDVSGWYIYANNGSLYSPGSPSVSYATAGTLIVVKLNRSLGQISFSVDGIDKGVAYSSLPKVPLVASVCLYQNGAQVEIDYTHSQTVVYI
jgi:hypothetical protein